MAFSVQYMIFMQMRKTKNDYSAAMIVEKSTVKAFKKCFVL